MDTVRVCVGKRYFTEFYCLVTKIQRYEHFAQKCDASESDLESNFRIPCHKSDALLLQSSRLPYSKQLYTVDILYTFDALVRCFEIRFEVLGTRLVLGELRIWNAYFTSTSTGASGVGQLEHIRLAAEVAVVQFHAPADPHTAVLGSCHDDHLVQCTSRVECLGFAKRCVVCHRRNGCNR